MSEKKQNPNLGEPGPILDRRQFLGGAAMASLAVVAVSGESLAVAGPVDKANAVGTEPVRGTVPLSRFWKIQPATSPEHPPKASDWQQNWPSADWRAHVDSASVNSLWYEQAIVIPLTWRGQHVVADFTLIAGDAIVFLNGQRVGELLTPGGEIDLSRQVKWGATNVLRIFVTRNYTGISRGFKQDPLRYTVRAGKIPMADWPLGITAPVTLFSRPRPTAITGVFVIPSWRNKTLTLDVEIESDRPEAGLQLEALIQDARQKQVLKIDGKEFKAASGRATYQITKSWLDPISWELGGGYLYGCEVRLLRHGKKVDVAPRVSFGFREIWTEERELLLNGHAVHWRMSWVFGAPSLSFFRLMGFDMVEIQANPSAWWGDWNEIPLLDEKQMAEMDATGWGAMVPVPTINSLGMALLNDALARADYERAMKSYLRRYWNHPSILAWTVGMIMYAPRFNISPQGMGRRLPGPIPWQEQVIEKAVSIVKSFDPTRLGFSQADGSVGDLSTSNMYMNWPPLQEQEERPKLWAASGNMPYGAVEFGLPISQDYWKGKRFLLTEYLAMYFGDEAYRKESDFGLRHTVEYGKLIGGTNGFAVINLDRDFPEYWDLQRLFRGNVFRAWRAWGINAGWLDWNYFDVSYGNPPGYNGVWQNRYAMLKEPVTSRPAWANPDFDITAQTMQPLLVYLGGAPQFTDKTHAYYEGEIISKQVVAVWDGPRPCSLHAHWEVTRKEDGGVVARGSEPFALQPGQCSFAPVSFQAPKTGRRTTLVLSLTIEQGGKVISQDSLPLQVFPRLPALHQSGRVIVYDPEEKSVSWIKTLGIHPTAWAKDLSFRPGDVLVIGRKALRSGESLPYTAADISGGLKAIVLEQLPEIWEELGFQTVETMSRYVFATDLTNPILDGIKPEDLINWRGSPDLLPEYRYAQSYNFQHAPRGVNTGAVASVVLQIPQVVGFTPILQAEFDHNYSPLLRWGYGQGAIFHNSVDLAGRVGTDPVATRLAWNLFTAAMSPVAATWAVFYAGDNSGREALNRLQLDSAVVPSKPLSDPERSLIVLGQGATSLTKSDLDKFVEKGGHVIVLPRSTQELESMGFKTSHQDLARASTAVHPWLMSIGPNLLRWRIPMALQVFAPTGQPAGCRVLSDGVFLDQKLGRGRFFFSQVGPDQLTPLLKDQTDRDAGLAMSAQHLHQLLAQILTAAGAAPSAALAERLERLEGVRVFDWLTDWRALGPYPAKGGTPAQRLNTPCDGEKSAIDGRTDLSIGYHPVVGQTVNWRVGVTAGENGFVNLDNVWAGCHDVIGYVSTVIHSDTQRTARLSLGVDYWLKAWLNGKVVYEVANGHEGAPVPNQFQTRIRLNKGFNVLTMKVLAGSRGFGFWASLSKPEAAPTARQAQEAVDLYPCKDPGWDPYQYFYW